MTEVDLRIIPYEDLEWAAGATSEHNDGLTKAGYRKKLENLRDYINIVLKGGDATK